MKTKRLSENMTVHFPNRNSHRYLYPYLPHVSHFPMFALNWLRLALVDICWLEVEL
jgi:hypothetical protein